jgi:hypothetical protein
MRALATALLLPCVLALAACGRADAQPENAFPKEAAAIVETMGGNQRIEMGIRADGSFDEIEFHVPYEDLPEPVRAAMEKLIPGGKVLDAEIEFAKGAKSYEVTKEVDGKEQEVLVDEKGAVLTWEIEVDVAKVPDAVQRAAENAAGGEVTAWEEIRDGAKRLTAYHVKKDDAGRKYKLSIAPDGKLEYVRREMTAEIEVTVR